MSSATPAVFGSPCVNCLAEPCRCIVEVLDRRGHDRTPLRKYRFPDGTVLRLDDAGGSEALARGAEILSVDTPSA